ncbi:MAG: 2,3-bisphosphoglycerate-dependent phosphoglycerate mutase [Candidatus Nanoarchaeia archaeon]|nr:2,3-bisphosphoglycerate-dependent phosphoglycerate mutase [Candidatus Nanoarchaeia archaeon]MDD5588018.1 2,3-bisphosphoglycerate-dependent phosphoglycerate mutase [Candidatus Nanoarchaeia archaeon]
MKEVYLNNFKKIIYNNKERYSKFKPKKNCKIYIFRHGRTVYNEKKIFTGWKDSKLTKNGIFEAKKVGNKLKNKEIDVAFCTSLSRSKDTLKEVLKFHKECFLVIQDDRMRERSYGNLQGISHKSFIEKYGKGLFDQYHRSYDIRPPKGESIKDVEKRVNSFIKDLIIFIKKNKVNVAISAHGNSMRPFRRYFEKLSVKEMIKLENPWDDYFEYEIK